MYKDGTYPLGQGSVDTDPWPGGANAPQPVSPGTSGEITVTRVDVSSLARPANGQGWQAITQWRSPRPAPVVLQLRVFSAAAVSAANPYASEALVPTQLSCTVGPQTLAAALRITYGIGNSLRVLETDLKAGSFQLPPCDFASVEGMVYGLGPCDLRIGAAITPGHVDGGARFTNTWRPTLAGGTYKTEPVPFGARWVSLCCDQYDLGGAVKLRLFAAGGPLIVQDYGASLFIGSPGQAIELASRSAVFLYNDGTDPAFCTVKFYLEP